MRLSRLDDTPSADVTLGITVLSAMFSTKVRASGNSFARMLADQTSASERLTSDDAILMGDELKTGSGAVTEPSIDVAVFKLTWS